MRETDDGFEEVVRNTKRRRNDETPLGTARSVFANDMGMDPLVSLMTDEGGDLGDTAFTTTNEALSQYSYTYRTSAFQDDDGNGGSSSSVATQPSFVMPSCPTQRQSRSSGRAPLQPSSTTSGSAIHVNGVAMEGLAVAAADEEEGLHDVSIIRCGKGSSGAQSSPISDDLPEVGPSFIRKPLYPIDQHNQFSLGVGDAFDGNVALQSESCMAYILGMLRNLAEPLHIRGKQGRLTLWEATEHFDIVNDLIFIYRVANAIAIWGNEQSHNHGSSFSANVDLERKQEIGSMVLYSLLGIWAVSVAAYCFRSRIIYHRIDQRNMTLFCPFVVFWKIRQVGRHCPDNLYMFERLSWTYQVLMRVIEDIPQVVASAVFATIYGADAYTCFMISWSAMLMLLTSYRMGVMYPVVGTASLLLSRQPPVDTPNLTEAAHTTRGFAVFLAFTFAIWSMSNLACLQIASGVLFMWLVGMQIALALLGVMCICYYIHLRQQASLDLTLGENLYPTSPCNDATEAHIQGPAVVELQIQGDNQRATQKPQYDMHPVRANKVSYIPIPQVNASARTPDTDIGSECKEKLLNGSDASIALDIEDERNCSDGCLTVRDEFPSPSNGVGRIAAE